MEEIQEFPKCLYLGGDIEAGYVVVSDEAQEAVQREKGFAGAGESAQAAEEEAPSLEELRGQAQELGIKVDTRWGAKRLQAEIAKAQ